MYLTLLLLLQVPPLWAHTLPDTLAGNAEQNCGLTLSGKTLDHDTREVLIGATVHIPELDKTAASDAYGNYHFHHLCQGTYTMIVTYVGYETERYTLKMVNSAVRDLQLHANPRTLGTVEVTGSHLKEMAQSQQTISGRELAETRGLALAETLRGIAGVTTLQTGPTISKPVIHGMHSNRVLLLNNGVRQEGQQWGAEHAPEIDPFVASEMKVIKGAAGVRYGADAIGGVIIVEPKPLRTEPGIGGEVHLLGSTNNRQLATSATLEGNVAGIPPLSWRLQGTLRKAGNSRTPDYYLENTGLEEQNFSAAVGYKKETYGAELFVSQFNTKLGILRESHIGNVTDLENAIARGRPSNADNASFTYKINRPYQDVQHSLLKAKGYWQLGEAGRLEFVYGWQRNLREEYDVHRSNSSALPSLQLTLNTHTTEAVFQHRPFGNFSGSVGINTIYQKNTYLYSDFLPYFTGVTAGVFAIEKWQKDRLQLEAGLRYDYKHLEVKRFAARNVLEKPTYNFNNVSGTLGAIYDVGYHLSFGLSATSAWRAPGANELFSQGVHHSAATYERGDPTLESEQAYNFELSVDYFNNARLNGTLSLYHNFINNYIYLSPLPEPVLTIRGAFPAFQYRQADATFKGVDLSLDYKLLTGLVLESKTALLYARNLDTDDYLIYMPANRFDNSLRYEFGQNGGQKKLSDAYVSFGGTYVTEQERVPVRTEEDFAPAPESYFLLHAEAGTTLHFGKQAVEIGITGNNLLNTTYRQYLNKLRYFADEPGRLLMFRIRVPLNFTKS
ncbi:TonB-dependent receptor [Pontibacter akesuensis]|uniref:Iron complex outermembrane recepter protein n=1 Tax=Pontibacter akesuensis TaxID=388950 RepID=A0A1I7I8U5_9BACT|nr:TonB-dependent receptor [Pontibacter akesuensis]GHA65859.1 membrane protein [Pontibacter akesuensis]SFU69403.1 iron complex outermembrane recepter protein [Pontibacter akesuensis]